MFAILRAAAIIAALAGAAGAAEERPVVPNFWDVRTTVARPDTTAIGTIRFLTSDDFPPFNFRDRRGVLIGFNVDLARAVCEVLEKPCTIQPRPFDTLAEALKTNDGDAVIAGLLPPPDTATTGAYFKIPGRFMAKAGQPFDPVRAEGPVGVACGTAHEAFLTAFFPKLKRTCLPSVDAALAELKAGRLQAVFGDALRLAAFANDTASADCCAFAGGPYLDDTYFGQGLSITVRADDDALREALDYALREVYRSGRYEELYLRYFPVGLF